MRDVLAFVDRLQKQPSLNKGLLLAILVALFIPHWISFYQTLNNSIQPDLLLRTIGSRLQQAGKPIYEYKWQVGEPVTLLNPYQDVRKGVNGVVSTPFFLWLFQPIAKLDYCTIRTIWGYIQEVLLFATIWLCCCTFKKRYVQLVFIIVAGLFFIYSRNWLLHIYNGQTYIIYAFIFSLAGYSVTKLKTSKTALFLYPLISLVRPFFLTAIIPMLQLKKQQIIYVATASVVAVLVSTATTTTTEWKQYNSAIELYAKERTGELAMDTISPIVNGKYTDACTINTENTFTSFGAGCLFSLQHYLYFLGLRVSDLLFFEVILIICFLITLYVAYKKHWLKDPSKQLLLSFLFYQLCELITPASRNPYNMIQWLPAIAWLIALGNKKITLIIIIGLCLNHDVPFWFKYEREIGEGLLFVALVLSLFQGDRTLEPVKH